MASVKTQVTRIQVGDTIDFDAHKGGTAFWRDSLDRPDGSHRPWKDWEKATGEHVVAAVERVAAPVTGGMHYGRATAIAITFANGRTIHAKGPSKFPVIAGEAK